MRRTLINREKNKKLWSPGSKSRVCSMHFQDSRLSIQLLTIDICQGKTICSVFTLQPKFRGCLQMTFFSFVRIFARLLLTSFENVLSHLCHHPHSVNYFEAFQQLLKYIPGTVYEKLVCKYKACMLSKPANCLFTSSTFTHVKSKCTRIIFPNSARGVLRDD